MPVCRPPRVEVARVAAVLGADQRGSRPGAHRRRASSRARPADTGTAAHRAADRPPAAGEAIPLADPASGARPGRHVDLDAGRAECGSRARFARRRSGTSTKTASKPAKRPAAKSAAQVGVRSTPASGGPPRRAHCRPASAVTHCWPPAASRPGCPARRCSVTCSARCWRARRPSRWPPPTSPPPGRCRQRGRRGASRLHRPGSAGRPSPSSL